MMAYSLKNQNFTIPVTSTTFIYWWGTIGNAMPEVQRKTVTTNVETLCNNMPIMNVVMTEVSEEDFEDNLENARDCYHLAGGRRKRATVRHIRCKVAHMAISKKKRSVPSEQMVHLLVGHQEHGC